VKAFFNFSLLHVTAALHAIGTTITASAFVACDPPSGGAQLSSNGAQLDCSGIYGSTTYGAVARASAMNGTLSLSSFPFVEGGSGVGSLWGDKRGDFAGWKFGNV
jgi:hypothetical protein